MGPRDDQRLGHAGGNAGAALAHGAAARLRELFAALAAGDAEALGPLYDLVATELHGLALWRTGSREDADDVVQELFCRLAERRDRLPAVDDPRAYLLAAANRLAIDRLRARTRRPESPLEHAVLVAAPETDPGLAADARRASRALARLPAKQRAALNLHQVCDLPYSAVARITGVPTFTAASRCRLALRALRRLLEPEP